MLEQANDELAYWEAIFKPIGYRVFGWTYKHTCTVISPTDKYVEVNDKIIELVETARRHPYENIKT